MLMLYLIITTNDFQKREPLPMNKLQIIVISTSVLLFMGLYFGFDTKPDKQKEINRQRELTAERTDISNLLNEARRDIPAEANPLLILAQKLDTITDTDAKVELLKNLSRDWYQLRQEAIAGYYAEKVAEILNTDEAWSIAGTTYTIGAQRAKEDKVRDFCFGRAIQAFESAISINPSNSVHKVNLAICYTENPPPENPMKGILMLRDLNQKEPDNVLVLTTLGRFAIQTAQFNKAIERLLKATSLDPQNNKAICLLAEAYKGLGDKENAAIYDKICSSG